TATDVSYQRRFSHMPIVRRLSGGGAIIHHHELTYSCAVPAGHNLARDPRQLYAAVHERIISVLAEFDVPAALRGATRPSQSQEFLCFARGDDFAVSVVVPKGLGSAHRHRKGAILQP